VIDSKLNWKSHINYVYDKALKLTPKLSSIALNKWGLSSTFVKTIYKGAILPLISYCAPIRINGLERKYNIQKIRRTQRLICLRLIRGYLTISYESSILLSGLEPIEFKLKQISDLFELKNGCV